MSNSCQPAGCGYWSTCFSDLDCTCGNLSCDAGETYANCPSDCSYDIDGRVFIDTNNNGTLNFGESGYNGATVTLNPGGLTDVTSGFGNNGGFNFNNQAPGSKTLTLSVPIGYQMSAGASNQRTFTLNSDETENFGIRQAPPVCSPAQIFQSPSGSIDAGETLTLSVSSCTDVENPDDTNPPHPFDWDPPGSDNPQCSDGINNDGDGLIDSGDPDCHTDGDPTKPYNPSDDSETTPSNTCSDGGTGIPTSNSSSSTVTYAAPTCPSTSLTCPVSVDVGGPGGITTYTRNITINATYNITTNIRLVSDNLPCTPTSGSAYTDSSISVNVNGGNLPVGGATQPTSTGQTVFACLSGGNYTVTIPVPAGYTIIDRSGGTDSGISGIAFNSISSNQTANFCLAQTDPWFQTTHGNVRLVDLINPVPLGQLASTNANYPGIFYSSESNAQFGFGSASEKNWVVNDEYSYNSETESKNGGLSYDFYKAKATRDGVGIRSISSGDLDWGQLDPTNSNAVEGGGTGVYEVEGSLTISSSPPAAIFNATNRSRITILVSGNVRIESPITIPTGQGLLILAAKEDIAIDSDIGTSDPIGPATLADDSTQLDGYYSAQGNVVLESKGGSCSDGSTSDRRLNVGGVLIANSLKPFSSSGLGYVQNERSLCAYTQDYPPLYILSRPDFLVQLTDFYKTSYSKWKEVSP